MTTTETVTDTLALSAPFVLQIGERRFKVEQRGLLTNERNHWVTDKDGRLAVPHVDPSPYSGTVTLSIDGNPVAAASYTRGEKVYDVLKYDDGTYGIHFTNEKNMVVDAEALKGFADE
jgi:hypothetical protein